LPSLLGGCNSKPTPNPPKSDENGQEMFNWSELHSERSNFLQNTYFSKNVIQLPDCHMPNLFFLTFNVIIPIFNVAT
jgi:hypothetical protein